jgi:hypothetical protein
MKPQTEKSNKHGSYTLWEHVQAADESMCGVYLTYEELNVLTANSHTLRIGFPLTIGFDMLLKLQAFNLFPNCVFGDLALVCKVTPDSLVWSCTDPSLFMKKRKLTINTRITSDTTNYFVDKLLANGVIPGSSNDYYDHRFVQFKTDGNARSCTYIEGTAIQNVLDAKRKSLPLRINPEYLETQDAVSTIMGFSLRPEAREALMSYCSSVPSVIPSENIYTRSYKGNR